MGIAVPGACLCELPAPTLQQDGQAVTVCPSPVIAPLPHSPHSPLDRTLPSWSHGCVK